MNNREKNSHEMIGAVCDYGDKEKSSFSPTPAIITNFSDLKTIHREITLNNRVLTEGVHGKVISKDVSQDEIITQCLVIAGAVYGYAADKNNSELMTFADINSKTFLKLRDSEVPVTFEKFIEKAEEVGDELGAYGINAEKITDARTKLIDYNNKFSGVGAGKGAKTTARKTITLLFDKAEKKLKVLDRLMLGFKVSNSELYARYLAARIIYDKPASSKGKDTPEEPDNNPPAN